MAHVTAMDKCSGLERFATKMVTFMKEIIRNDQRHGKGNMTYADQEEWYDGPYRDDQKWGDDGTMVYADKSIYRGQWERGQPHGAGSMPYANGDSFKGNYESGLRRSPLAHCILVRFQ
jgi:hypothetical protein